METTPRKTHPLLKFPLLIAAQTLGFAVSGFSLIAALAWNEVVKALIQDYVKPYLGANSGIISLLIYAVVVTIIAVIVSLQIGAIQKRLSE